MNQPAIQDMEIWDQIVEMAMFGFSLTTKLKQKYRFRIADSLQQAVLGFYLNIADGSVASSGVPSHDALNVARRSLLDTAYIVTLLQEKRLVSNRMARLMVPRLEGLSLELSRFQSPS